MKRYVLIMAFIFGLSATSCVTVREEQSAADYLGEVQRLQRLLLEKPDDTLLLTELGVTHFHLREYESARRYLHRAFVHNPADPRSMFYLGLSMEYLDHIESALAIYINYDKTPSSSRFRSLLEGRYHALVRDVIRRQIESAVQNEAKIGATNISPQWVAVFPLQYRGSDERYAPLGKGLSEMLLVDLGQINGLKLVERIRTEELLRELKFGESQMVDQTSAPRLGKLVSAGRIVSGSLNVLDDNLRMDVAAWDIVQKKFPEYSSHADDIENLFRVEKDIVFAIVDEFDIQLTPEEREKILRIPTKNFLAFMSYCLGLRSEDALDFVSASVYYNQAMTLDPQFELAVQRASAMEAVKSVGASKENALAAAKEFDRPLRQLASLKKRRLIEIRLGNLSEGLGKTFTPGDDDREPAEEAFRGGAGIGKLPEPPPPPAR